MAVKTLEVGELSACCYIVNPDSPPGEGKPCVVIDPGAEADRITEEVKQMGLHVEAILLTHSHPDHIGGVADLMALWPDAILACSEETARRAADPKLNLSAYMGTPISCPAPGRFLADGEVFHAAWMDWKAVEVPGHDPGEMVFILGDGMLVFTGDTIFNGSVGRSDFPGGNEKALLAGLAKLLASLPPEAILFPGHGPATQARIEIEHNPFLQGLDVKLRYDAKTPVLKKAKRYPAKIMMLPPEIGGRRNPAASGYQGLLKIDDEYTSVRVFSKSGPEAAIPPGAIHNVEMELVFEDVYGDRMTPGMQILLFEMPRIVGVGVLAQ